LMKILRLQESRDLPSARDNKIKKQYYEEIAKIQSR